MTRINLVPPVELMDQHLFAEFREIKMVPKALRRSLLAAHKREHRGKSYPIAPAQPWDQNVMLDVLGKIPSEFTLNAGHVSFFYNKGSYLHDRYHELRVELDKHNINYDKMALLDSDMVFNNLPDNFWQEYIPTSDALAVIRQRIKEKIELKPNWYRYYGKGVDNK